MHVNMFLFQKKTVLVLKSMHCFPYLVSVFTEKHARSP